MLMFARLREFFDEQVNREHLAGDSDREQDIRLATAALLLEVARADFSVDAAEAERIATVMQNLFALDASATRTLLELAEAELHDATCLHGFTDLINDHWTMADKIAIIEHMWAVAYTDHIIDKHERHLLRKVAGLLYIPDADYVATRLRAKRANPGTD